MCIITTSVSQGRKRVMLGLPHPCPKRRQQWPVISQIPLLEPLTGAGWLLIMWQGSGVIEMKHTWTLIAHSPGSAARLCKQHCLPCHSHSETEQQHKQL